MPQKLCAICGASFMAAGRSRTCGAVCSAALRTRTMEEWRARSAERVIAYRRAYYEANRDAVLDKCRGRNAKPAIEKVCLTCGMPFIATGRGGRCALTCSIHCRAKRELSQRSSRPANHPTRHSDVARVKRWVSEHPERAKQLTKAANRRATQNLTDARVADLLGLPVAVARPLIAAKRAHVQIHRELKKRIIR